MPWIEKFYENYLHIVMSLNHIFEENGWMLNYAQTQNELNLFSFICEMYSALLESSDSLLLHLELSYLDLKIYELEKIDNFDRFLGHDRKSVF